jgi:hypothetical protein
VTTPTVPTVPLLGHVEGVELVETGSWNAASGPVTFTADDLASAVAALDCPAVRRPVLKAGHDGNHGVGEPALGYVSNLRLSNEGQTLVGDYRGMPAWLTSVNDSGDSVLASAYPDRSIEGEFGHRCQLGHEHPFVVHAVSLLGVELPAVGTLQSLQELYGVVAATTPSPGGQQVVVLASARQETAVPQQITAAATTDDVRRAYYSGPGSDWDLWIREMYVDPPELIVDNDGDGSILRVPYSIDEAGEVTFGEPQKVKVTYVNARAASGDEQRVVFASRAESRPGQRPEASTTPDPSTAPAAEPAAPGGTTSTNESEGTMPDLSEGVRERLGLAADAGEDTILAALDEALTKRAETPPVAASTPPDGTVLIESAVLEELRVQAAAGAEARAQQQLEHRTRTVDAAISEGRIAPARRDHWLAQLAADPGAETVLASLAKGTVPLTELGAPGSGEDTSEDDAVYASIYGDQKKGA